MNSSKKMLVVVAAIGLVAGLVACATVDVTSDFDPAANFASYKTFAVASMPEFNSITAGRIQTAITQALQAKGLTPVAENPDLSVEVAAKIANQKQINSTGWGGYGYGRYGYGGWGGGMSTTTVQDIAVGTLVVGLMDASAKKLVWRGTATKTLDESTTGQEKQQVLNDALTKMFSNFPPKGGK